MRMTMIHRIFIFVTMSVLVGACTSQDLQFEGSVEKVTDGLDFPEGPVFAGYDLLFSNCYGMWIGRFSEEGRLDTFADLSGMDFKPNGLYWSEKNFLWACEYNMGRILKLNASGEVVSILDNHGERFSRPNDMTYYNGLIYFTDPKSYSGEILDGCIYTLDPETEEIRLLTGGLAFPNGIAVDSEGENLYVCESALNRISVLSLKNPEARHVLINLPGGDPDGIEFYDDNTLLAAHFGGGKVYSINVSEKAVTDSIELPGKRVTNCVISHDKQTLYISEATTNAIYKIKINN